MNPASIFASAFVLGLSGAMMPGSLLVVNISETSRRGLAGGMLAVAGHALLELLVVLGFALGLGSVLARESVAGAIGLAGSAMLAWMAYGIIRTAWRGATMPVAPDEHPRVNDPHPRHPRHPRRALEPCASTDPDGSSGVRSSNASGSAPRSGRAWPIGSLVAGGLATISNPYWILWWATIGATSVGLALQRGIAASGAFFVGHISSDFAWYFLVSLVIVTGRKLITDRVYRGLLLTCGAFLVALAAYFASAAIRMVLG